MDAGASDAALDPSCSVAEILSLAGKDIVEYVTWSGILGNLTALFERAIAHVPCIACVDSPRLLMRASLSETSFWKGMQSNFVGVYCQNFVSNICSFAGLRTQ